MQPSSYQISFRSDRANIALSARQITETLEWLRDEDDSYHASRRFLGHALDQLNDDADSLDKALEHLPEAVTS